MNITISGSIKDLCRLLGTLDEQINDQRRAEVAIKSSEGGDLLVLTLEEAQDEPLVYAVALAKA
jgi:hypothetical protein